MDKIKAMLVGFVKPLILAHVSDLSALAPMLIKAIVSKSNLSQDQASALAPVLIDVVETELMTLINKI